MVISVIGHYISEAQEKQCCDEKPGNILYNYVIFNYTP